jgi:hypothetical protein
MSFLIPCQSCGVEFVLPPDAGVRRVIGSVVTVRCRSCNSRIVADDLELVLEFAAEQPSIRPGEAFIDIPPGAPASARSQELAQRQGPPSSPNGYAPPSSPNGYAPPSSPNGYAPPSSPNGYAPPSGDGQDAYGAPSSGGYAPVSSVELIESAPNTPHSREAQGEASSAQRSAPASERTPDGPPSQRGEELSPITPRGLGQPSEVGAGRQLPRAPVGPVQFTGSLPPEEGGPRHFDEPPPSSGTPDLMALRGRAPAGGYVQRGPDSTTRQLLSFSAGLPGTLPMISEQGAPTIQPIIQSTLIQGSTAPVSMDADTPPSSRARSEREPESAPQSRPRRHASDGDRARERNLTPWILGLAALIVLGVLAVNKLGAGGAAAEQAIAAQHAAAGNDMTIEMDEPGLPMPEPSAPVNEPQPMAEQPPAVLEPAQGLQQSPRTEAVARREPEQAKPQLEAEPKPESKQEEPELAAEAKPAAETQEVPAAPPIDMAALKSSLNGAAAQASSCRQAGDPSGSAQAKVTFAPSGRVTSAQVTGAPFAGTATGGCIAARLRAARIPAFSGDHVTVGKTIWIE